jgi:hypothetical protein
MKAVKNLNLERIYNRQYSASPCFFATIPNAFRQCAVFVDDHSFRPGQGFGGKAPELLNQINLKRYHPGDSDDD